MIEQHSDPQAELHALWSSVAGAWAEHAGFVDARSAGVTARMLEHARPRPGERVLELACGPGGAGIAAAPLVAPGGEVVLSDIAPEMVEIAIRRAAAAGVGNASARVLDLEDVDEPEASFDVALCREGLMLVRDPALAAGEIRRVLRTGGRAAIAVWGARERNPWLGLILDALSAELGQAVPPPGTPHPFSLGGPGQLEELLTAAGFSDVSIEELPTPNRVASPREWWERSASLAGPLAKRLRTLPPELLAAAQARAFEAVGLYETPDGLEIPGLCLLASARR